MYSYLVGATAGNATSVTTAAIDTTGASLLVVVASKYYANVTGVLTDSKGNTWTPLTLRTTSGAGNQGAVQIYYAANPIVGSGHTVNIVGTGNIFTGVAFSAWTAAVTSSPFDQQNGNNANTVSTIATGSVTPSENNELLIVGVSVGNGSTSIPTIDASFNSPATQFLNYNSGVNFGVAMLYQVQTTATARNPTVTLTVTGAHAVAIATFKAAATGGAVQSFLSIMGVG